MRKVLIIDDDRELLEVFQDILELSGYQVQTVASASQAIDTLPKFMPDAVLLDMNLVQTSGTVVLAFIRRHPNLKNAKVIIITGDSSFANHAADFWDSDDVLIKPIPPATLRETIAQQLNGEATRSDG